MWYKLIVLNFFKVVFTEQELQYEYNYKDWEETPEDYIRPKTETTTVSPTITTTLEAAITTTTTTTELTTISSSEYSSPSDTTTPTLKTSPLGTTMNSTSITDHSPSRATTTPTPITITTETTAATESTTNPTTTFTTVSTFISTTPTETTYSIPQTTSPLMTTERPIMSIPQGFNLISYDIEAVKRTLKSGYFTASAVVFLNIAISKREEHLSRLVSSLYAEVQRLNAHHELDILDKNTISVLVTLLHVLATMDPIEFYNKASYGIFAIEQRMNEISPEGNAVIDALDNIYTEADRDNVVHVLEDVKKFPANKSEFQIANAAIEAFLLIPLKRVEGTLVGKTLLLEIKNFVDHRLFGPSAQYIDGPRRSFLDKIITKIVNYLTLPPTTKKPTLPDINSVYLKNETLRNYLKDKMKEYKERQRRNRKYEEKMNTKRGLTTTTIIYTTITKIPPMRKSKYYIMKYVKKNLYKMTTKSTKTTRDPWRFYTNRRKRMSRTQVGSDINSDILMSNEILSKYRKFKIKNRESKKNSNKKGNSRYRLRITVDEPFKEKGSVEITESKRHPVARNSDGSFNEHDSNVFDKNMYLSQYNKIRESKHGIVGKKLNKYMRLKHKINRAKMNDKLENSIKKAYLEDELHPYISKGKQFRKLHRHFKKLESDLPSVITSEEKNSDQQIVSFRKVVNLEKSTKKKIRKLKENFLKADAVETYSDGEANLKQNLYKALGYESDFGKYFKRHNL